MYVINTLQYASERPDRVRINMNLKYTLQSRRFRTAVCNMHYMCIIIIIIIWYDIRKVPFQQNDIELYC